MAKPLVFQLGDRELAFTLQKVDRSQLYGSKEMEVLDETGERCELATLADDGRTVVGKGGTGLGYISADGHWCDKGKLTPIDLEGNEIEPVVSSYSAPIKLFETASVDQYLDHNVRLVYLLATEDEHADLVEELRRGTIFVFPFSYRGGLEADAGFLLMGDGGEIFMTVGNPTRVEFIGLQQTATLMIEDEEADETDLMDFDMI